MKKTNTNTIGSRIKEMRLKKGMTQEQLAEQLCTTKPLISQYENNKIDIKSSIVVELAEILNRYHLQDKRLTPSDALQVP